MPVPRSSGPAPQITATRCHWFRNHIPPALARGTGEDHGVDAPPDEASVPRLTEHPAVVSDDPAPQEGHHRPARDLPALPRAVVGDVEVLPRERLADPGVDEDEVGVAPRRDHALLRVEPEDPRGVGGGHGGEALERHTALDHAL